MNNLDALKKKHAELGEEIARLEKRPDYNDHPHLFVDGDDDKSGYYIGQDAYGRWLCSTEYDMPFDCPVFHTKGIAEAHAQAQEIVHRVKAMGVAYVEREWNWTISVNKNFHVYSFNHEAVSNLSTFGCFGTGDEGKARAQHAIDTVGEENIAWAARVLAGGGIGR